MNTMPTTAKEFDQVRASTGAQSKPARGLTQILARQAAGLRYETLPENAALLTRQCVLDYLGVTLAGASDPVSDMILAEMQEQGGTASATIYGRGVKLPGLSAALVNGTFSHALDFDDVNMALPGHPSVAILPGLLALAEERRASGRELIAAFVAGYELAARVGLLMAPGHYNTLGFHSTATIGSLGAAAAAGHLLGLTDDEMATAISIAATQAGGLKSLFGTMCKPFHAGKAASNGLLAARLAKRGFTGRTDILECVQGFARSHSPDYHEAAALAEPRGGLHMRANLFKYHAACYLTHAAIECCRRLRAEHALTPDAIKRVVLRIDQSCGRVCNILEPRTGLEAKFSLRLTTAMALAGIDTARLGSYSDVTAQDRALVALRDRVEIEFQDGWSQTESDVAIETVDGHRFMASHDAGVPAADLTDQGRRLADKFMQLVEPLYGSARAQRIVTLTHDLDGLPDISVLAEACSSAIAA